MTTPRFYNNQGHLTAYAFRCGLVEDKGHVKIHHQDNLYWIYRDHLHPCGPCNGTTYTLTMARIMATRFRKEKPKR